MDQEQLKINLWLKSNLPKFPTRLRKRQCIKPPVQFEAIYKYSVDNRQTAPKHTHLEDSLSDISRPPGAPAGESKSIIPTDHRDSSGDPAAENDLVRKLRSNLSDYLKSLPSKVYNEALLPPMISWGSELTELYENTGASIWKSVRDLDI
jgi:hypothetical protein